MAVKDFHVFMLISNCVRLWRNMKELSVCTRVIDFWMNPQMLCRGRMVPFFSRTKEVASSEAQEGSQMETNRHSF